MEKHFLSHFEVLCSTWAICGYNIHIFPCQWYPTEFEKSFPLVFSFSTIKKASKWEDETLHLWSQCLCWHNSQRRFCAETQTQWAPRSIHLLPHRDHTGRWWQSRNTWAHPLTTGPWVLHGLQRFQRLRESHVLWKLVLPYFWDL